MKALRIVLNQSKANYRKEETVDNKMTYPLPPFSTIIGSIHKACGFKEYKPMDLSIQGKYESLSKQAYTDYCFLDSLNDDRGILVKVANPNLYGTSFEKVASALKTQGNSFKKNITIKVHNEELLSEYQQLKELSEKISDFKNNRLKKVMALFKKRKESLKDKKNKFDKKSEGFEQISKREREIKEKEKLINEKTKEFERKEYAYKISHFMNLTTSLKFYEVLQNVRLVIHVKAEEETLKIIEKNIFNIKAIGRSEDFVDVEDCQIVELKNGVDKEVLSKYSAYLNSNRVRESNILLNEREEGIPASGTKYWLNKKYKINEEGKRVFFDKVRVIYASNYFIDDESEDVFYDKEGNYIVDFN